MHTQRIKKLITTLAASCLGLGLQAAVYKEVGGIVVVEAEHFDKRNGSDDDHAWKIIPDEDPGHNYLNPRGAKYMEVTPDSGQNRNNVDAKDLGPTLDYKVKISVPGIYRMHLRAIGFDGASDSMYVSIVELVDGADSGTPEVDGVNADWYRKAPLPQTGNFADMNNGAGWDGDGGAELVSGDAGGTPMLWTLKAGTYTVRMFQREDAIGLDSFCLQLAKYGTPAQNIPESPIDDGKPAGLVFAPVPSDGSSAASFDSTVGGIFVNGSTTLNESSVKLTVDGAVVSPKTTKDGAVISVEFQPESFYLPGSKHTASIEYKDSTGATMTKSWEFTTARYALIPKTWAVTPNASQPGFIWNVFQNAANQDNTTKKTEDALAGALNGADGQPLPNQADPAATGAAKGAGKALSAAVNALVQFEVEGVINFSQTADENNGAFTPDLQMPGIPGTDGGADGIAAEALTYITLPAGRIRMGVNSDDGFKTTVSSGSPRDKFSLFLGEFSGGRGAADTLFDFVVESAGTYAFRTAWEEGGGGANVEWFIVANDKKVLINDVSGGGPKAYRSVSGASPAVVIGVAPAPDSSDVVPGANIEVLVEEGATPVDIATVKLALDGAAVTPKVSKNGRIVTISYDPPTDFVSPSTHSAKLSLGSRVEEWTFRVPPVTKDKVSGKPGLVIGSATFSADKGGRSGAAGDFALDTSGAGVVNVPDASFFNAASADDTLTVAYFQKLRAVGNSSAFWANSTSSSGSTRGFQAHSTWGDQTVYFDTAGCCAADTQRISKNMSEFPGYTGPAWLQDWHHFAFVKDKAAKRIYIDGKLFHEGGGDPLPTDFVNLILGGGPGATDNRMNGFLDDFTVYNAALSEAQVKALASGTAPGALSGGGGLLAHWDFNDPPAAAPAAVKVFVTRSGNNVTITSDPPALPAGWVLQTSAKVDGPWATQAGVTTPVTVPIGSGTAFLRAIKP